MAAVAGAGPQDDEVLADLGSWVFDEARVVSYAWMARSLGTPANEAKRCVRAHIALPLPANGAPGRSASFAREGTVAWQCRAAARPPDCTHALFACYPAR